MANTENKKEETGLQKREAQLPEGVERTKEGRQFLPLSDIYETNDAVVVVADMPGVSADDVDITLERNLLTIHGRAESAVPEGFELAYAEYEVGDFSRSFTLSEQVDRDGIEAKMADGVLTLTLPKSTPTMKRIDVKTE
jgi:HSP20 family molecular chaperone IbpA